MCVILHMNMLSYLWQQQQVEILLTLCSCERENTTKNNIPIQYVL